MRSTPCRRWCGCSRSGTDGAVTASGGRGDGIEFLENDILRVTARDLEAFGRHGRRLDHRTDVIREYWRATSGGCAGNQRRGAMARGSDGTPDGLPNAYAGSFGRNTGAYPRWRAPTGVRLDGWRYEARTYRWWCGCDRRWRAVDQGAEESVWGTALAKPSPSLLSSRAPPHYFTAPPPPPAPPGPVLLLPLRAPLGDAAASPSRPSPLELPPPHYKWRAPRTRP
jgi:hypothetical protein